MIESGQGEPSPAEPLVDPDELRAHRERFLQEMAADYGSDTFDPSEIERLVAEARRLH